MALQLTLAPLLVHDWDGFVFLRSVEDFLAGESPYEVAEADPSYIHLNDTWPPLNTWYAYPPLALLLLAIVMAPLRLLSHDPMWLRVALKLSFILGNLALAYVGGRLAAHLATQDPESAQRRAERLLLFNPFLIFIAAGWGMFDSLMMALLLGAVVFLKERRPGWAGVAFGAAVLAKVFPLFVAPLFLGYAWRALGHRAAGRFVAFAVGTFALVSLPFLIEAPRGFLLQTLLLHGERGIQGFALVSAPLHVGWLAAQLGIGFVPPSGAALATFSAALLGLAFVIICLRSLDIRGERALLHASLAAFLLFLLVSKVVNEQYLVMPVSLLAVLAATDERSHRASLRAFTWGGLASSLLLGLHFITFVPPDVAARLLPAPPEVLLHDFLRWVDVPFLVALLVVHFIAVLVLVPALLQALRTLAAEAGALAPIARGRARRVGTVAASFGVILLVVGAPLLGATLDEPEPSGPAAVARHALFSYDLAIRNPGHSPDVRAGFWAERATPVPADGYYSINAAKVRDDLRAMRAMGATGVLVGIDAGNGVGFPTLLAAASENGMSVGLVLDTRTLAYCPEAQKLPFSQLPAVGETPGIAHADLLRACLADAFAQVVAHPAALRQDGRPVLFVKGVAGVVADWAPAAVLDVAPDALLVAAAPADEPVPPWASGHAPEFSPTDQDAAGRLARAIENASGLLPVVPLLPPTTSEAAFREMSDAALATDSAWLLLPWNDYRHGLYVEPTMDADLRTEVARVLRAVPLERTAS